MSTSFGWKQNVGTQATNRDLAQTLFPSSATVDTKGNWKSNPFLYTHLSISHTSLSTLARLCPSLVKDRQGSSWA